MCTSHRLRLAAVLGLLSFACAGSARTQRGITEPREIEAPFAPSSQRPARGPSETLDPGLGLIKLDVVVTDPSGTPIPGIPFTDFTVLDNGEPSSIFSFQAFDGVSAKPDPPVEVILVIDTLQVPGDLIRYERGSVETFLRRNGGHLAAPVSVLTLLDGGLWQMGQTSSDGNLLASLIARNRDLALIHHLPGGLKANPSRDALKALGAIATAERQRPGRKLLLWVGPGWGAGSGAYGEGHGDGLEPGEDLFYTIWWFNTLLREARIALYSFSVEGTDTSQLYRGYLPGAESFQRAQFMHFYRKVLAVESGGLVLDRSDDLAGQIESCVREAGVFYTLSLNPSHADHVDEYHALQVQVDRPGLTARTKTGYYDQPFYSDQRSPAIRRFTVEQLGRWLDAVHGEPDTDMAAQISSLELTERLTGARLTSWTASMHGKKSQQALLALADQSAFLPPPSAEISAETPPDTTTQQRMISLTADYLKNTMPKLPDFFAIRTTIRYEETAKFDAVSRKMSYEPLRTAENFKETVTYRNGNEIADSGAGKRRHRETSHPYLITYGTFGPVLDFVRDAISAPGALQWSRWEQGPSGPRAVFRYAIPAKKSPFRIRGCCLPDGYGTSQFDNQAGYHGEIAIDPASGAILRLQGTADLKAFPPVVVSDIMITYGPVEIGGKTYICPLRSVSILRSRSVNILMEGDEGFRTYGPYATLVNDITYKDYHMSRGESRLMPGFKPEAGESFPHSGSAPAPAAVPPPRK
jgi:VWFA-related protein